MAVKRESRRGQQATPTAFDGTTWGCYSRFMIPRKFVIVGPGAVGSCIAAWLVEAGLDVYVHGRPHAMGVIEERGIRHYKGSLGPSSAQRLKPGVLRSLEVLGEADILVFCTKNRDLEEAASSTARECSGRPFALSLANGLENQGILPRHFARHAYGIVGFNCWLDEIGLVGWQSRGPLVLGTTDNSFVEECGEIATQLARGVPAETTLRFQDAAHAKLVVNLANTVTTLVGQGYRPIDDIASLQRILYRTLAEGVRVVEAAGHRGFKIGDMPTFGLIRALDAMPALLTRGIFKRNLVRMVKSSMSQDVFQKGRHDTELESLTGYLVRLAREVGLAAPWNEGLYRIAKEGFADPEFKPLEPAALLSMLEQARSL